MRFVLIVALLATVVFAASDDTIIAGDEIILFPAGSPNETAGFPGPEVRRSDGGIGCGASRTLPCDHFYNVSRPTLTPFLVTNGTGGAVVIAPGGGYRLLSWSKEGLDVARMFNLMGVSAFVLKYRVPARPNLPFGLAPLQDAQRAIGVVRAGAAKWDLDPAKIGFIGFSAGGHLAAHVSTVWRKRAYPWVDAADDLSCRPDFSLLIYPWKLLKNNNKTSTDLSPEVADVEKDHPPTFFAQNSDDQTAFVQNVLQYNLKLVAAGASNPTTHIYPKGGHGFGLCQQFEEFQEVCDWPQAAKRFVQFQGAAPGFPDVTPKI